LGAFKVLSFGSSLKIVSFFSGFDEGIAFS
jgi:hypothetical protein